MARCLCFATARCGQSGEGAQRGVFCRELPPLALAKRTRSCLSELLPGALLLLHVVVPPTSGRCWALKLTCVVSSLAAAFRCRASSTGSGARSRRTSCATASSLRRTWCDDDVLLNFVSPPRGQNTLRLFGLKSGGAPRFASCRSLRTRLRLGSSKSYPPRKWCGGAPPLADFKPNCCFRSRRSSFPTCRHFCAGSASAESAAPSAGDLVSQCSVLIALATFQQIDSISFLYRNHPRVSAAGAGAHQSEEAPAAHWQGYADPPRPAAHDRGDADRARGTARCGPRPAGGFLSAPACFPTKTAEYF